MPLCLGRPDLRSAAARECERQLVQPFDERRRVVEFTALGEERLIEEDLAPIREECRVSFDLQSRAAATRERVILGLPVVFRRSPCRGDPLALFEPVQRGIERALTDGERIIGRLLDPAGDEVTVSGSPAEGFQDQKIQRASENFRCRCRQ